MKYIFVVATTVSLATEVEADSLTEAIEKAKMRSAQSICYKCAKGSDDTWNLSGEIDGDPSAGELVDLFTEHKNVSAEEFSKAVDAWENL